MGWLLLGSDGRVDIEVMADKVRVDLGGIAGIPCKYINISFKKLNQLLLLLKRQLSPYPKEFLQVTTNNHLFQIFAFRLLDSCVRGQNRSP